MRKTTVWMAVLVCLCMLACGCGTGKDPQTGEPVQAVDGTKQPVQTPVILEDQVIEEMLDYPCPSVTVTDLYGQQWDLSMTQEKVLVLAFWDDTCADAMASIHQFHLEQGEDGQANVVTVVTGNDMDVLEADVRDIIAERDWEMPVMLDDDTQSAARALEVVSLPAVVVVDGNGVVRYVNPGIPEQSVLEEQVFHAAAMLAVG